VDRNLLLVVLTASRGIWVSLPSASRTVGSSPSIIMFCCIGNYSVNNSGGGRVPVRARRILGYALVKLECEPAPLILGYVLGPLMEEYLAARDAALARDPTVFHQTSLSFAS